MSDEALLPCPFCGNDGEWTENHSAIKCSDWSCPVSGAWFRDAYTWNQRADGTGYLRAIVRAELAARELDVGTPERSKV